MFKMSRFELFMFDNLLRLLLWLLWEIVNSSDSEYQRISYKELSEFQGLSVLDPDVGLRRQTQPLNGRTIYASNDDYCGIKKTRKRGSKTLTLLDIQFNNSSCKESMEIKFLIINMSRLIARLFTVYKVLTVYLF